jgi:hypothetical protein
MKRLGNTAGTLVKGIPLLKATGWKVQVDVGES